MEGTYYKFKVIMQLVEQYPNDQELGAKVREEYWLNYKKNQQDPNQLRIDFPDDEIVEDKDIDSIAHRAID